MEGLLHEVYASFIDTGTRLYFDTGRSELARDTFEAVEENARQLSARLSERRQFHRSVTPRIGMSWQSSGPPKPTPCSTRGGTAPGNAPAPELDPRDGNQSRWRGLKPARGLLARVPALTGSDTILLTSTWVRRAPGCGPSARPTSRYTRLPGRGDLIGRSRQFRQAVLTGDLRVGGWAGNSTDAFWPTRRRIEK